MKKLLLLGGLASLSLVGCAENAPAPAPDPAPPAVTTDGGKAPVDEPKAPAPDAAAPAPADPPKDADKAK